MFNKLLIICICIFSFTLQNSFSSNIDVSLIAGWNLVSFPMNENQTNVASFLDTHLYNENGSTITSNEMVQEVWGYNQKWECSIFPSSTTTCEFNLSSLKVHHGYWLLVSQNGTLRFSSDEYGIKALEITSPGWHLLGMNIKEPSSFKDKILFPTSFYSNHGLKNISKIMNYNSLWKDYYSEDSRGALQTMEAGRGYWFYVEELNQTINQQSPLSIQIPKINSKFVPKNPIALSQDSKVALSWAPINGASTYNVYYSTSSSLSTTNYTEKLSVNNTSNTTKTNLLNGTKYYFLITAQNVSGESKASVTIQATPQIDPPVKLNVVNAVKGNQQATVSWDLISTASSYNIYSSTNPNVSLVDYENKVSIGNTNHSTLSALTNGLNYYFLVTAVNIGGEGQPSSIVTTIPQVPAPSAPINFGVSYKDSAVTLTWNKVNLATSYNLYYSTNSGLTKQNSIEKISLGDVSSYIKGGLTNGTQYFFLISALNAGGESVVSLKVSATPQVLPPSAPQNFIALAGDREITLSWDLVNTASTYDVYTSTNSSLSQVSYDDKVSVSNTTILTKENLRNDQAYYFLVTASNIGGDSNPSTILTTAPKAILPSISISALSDVTMVIQNNSYTLNVTTKSNGGKGSIKVQKYLSLNDGLTWQKEDSDILVNDNVEKAISFSLVNIPYSDHLRFKVRPLLEYTGIVVYGEDQVTKSRFEYYPLSYKDFVVLPKVLQMDHSSSVYNGKIYYLGGGKDFSDSYFISYNPISKSWKTLNPMPEGRRKHVSFVYNDKLYVYGGIDRLGEYQSSFLIYNFVTSTWKKQTTTGPRLKDLAAIAINGSFYIWGGRDKNLVNNRVMYQYNLQSNIFTSLGTFESGLEQLNTPQNPRVQGFCLAQDKLFLVSGKAKTSKVGLDTFGQISYASAPLNNLSSVSSFKVVTLQTNVSNSNNKFAYFCDNEELYISAAYYSPGAFINKINLLEQIPQIKVVTKQNKITESHTIQKVNNQIISIYEDQNSTIKGFSSYVGTPSYKKDTLEYVIENPSVKRVGKFLHFEYDLVAPKETLVFVSYGLETEAIFENYFLDGLSISSSGHVTHRLDWTKLIFTTQKNLNFKAYLTDENGGNYTISFPSIDLINPLFVSKLSPIIKRSRYAQANNNTSLFIFGGEYGDGLSPNENIINLKSYSFSLKQWKSLKKFYTEYTQLSSIAVDNNFVYLSGGSNGTNASSQFIKYDIALDSFIDLGGLPFVRFAHKSIIYNNRLYLIGGSSIVNYYGIGDDTIDHIDIYDLSNNQWLSSIQGIVSNILDIELINDELYLLGVSSSNNNLLQKVDLLTNKSTLLPNPKISTNLFSLGRIEDFLVVTTKNQDHLQLYNIYSKSWVFDTVDLLKENFKIESSFGVSDSLYLLGTYDYFNQLDLYELKININSGLSLTESSNRLSGDFSFLNNITSIQIQSSEDRGRTYVTTTVANIDLINNKFTYDFLNADVNRLLKLTIHTDQGETFFYDYDFLSSKKNIKHCVSVDMITPSTLINPSSYLTDVNVSVGGNINTLKLFQYVKGSTNSENIYEITTSIARKNFTFSNIALTETTGSFSNHFQIITQTGCETSHEIVVNNQSFQPNFQILSVKNKTMFDLDSPYKVIKNYPTIEFKTDVPLKIKNVRAIYPFTLNGKNLEDYKSLSYLEKSFAKPGTYQFVLTNGLVSPDLYLPFGEFYIEIQIEKLGDSSQYSRFKVFVNNGVINEFVKFNMVH